MSKTVKSIFVVSLFAAGVVAGANGCGGVTDHRASARERATIAGCNYFLRCDQLGPNTDDAYVDYSSCEIGLRSFWDNAWPAATCQDRINQGALNVCINAINGTQCGNGLAFLGTLVTCGEASVCIGTTPDGGG